MKDTELRGKIIDILKGQGFDINLHVKPADGSGNTWLAVIVPEFTVIAGRVPANGQNEMGLERDTYIN